MESEAGAHEIDLAGKRAIAAIDFHRTRVYALDPQPHAEPDVVQAFDPRGIRHNVFHHHGNHMNLYANDNPEYWRELAAHLVGAEEVLLLGNGFGKANASHLFEQFVERHRPELARKIVANVRVDLSSITDEQLLRLGQVYFNETPRRHEATAGNPQG